MLAVHYTSLRVTPAPPPPPPLQVTSHVPQADLVDKRQVTEEEAIQVQEELELEKYLECGVFDGDKPDRTRVVQLFSGNTHTS